MCGVSYLPKTVPLFGCDMVGMWLLWAPHTSWCTEVSRNAPHAWGENTRCSKSQLRMDMQAWASSSIALTDIGAIFCCIFSTYCFSHYQRCTEQSRHGNVRNTRKAYQYIQKFLSNRAKTRSETQTTVYELPYHKDTIRIRKAYQIDHRCHHSTNLFISFCLSAYLSYSTHPSIYL
jgi:hypothetical protein